MNFDGLTHLNHSTIITCALNNRAPKEMKQKMKGEIHISKVIVGVINILVSMMDRITRQKINGKLEKHL
jgi:hypothetical protein